MGQSGPPGPLPPLRGGLISYLAGEMRYGTERTSRSVPPLRGGFLAGGETRIEVLADLRSVPPLRGENRSGHCGNKICWSWSLVGVSVRRTSPTLALRRGPPDRGRVSHILGVS